MKRAKCKAILCSEVVPGAFYLAPQRDEKAREDCIAEVVCSIEPGWQRGFVVVTPSSRSPSSGSAVVRFVEDGVLAVLPVYKLGEDWAFTTGPEKYHPTTLRQLPEDYFDKRLLEIQQQINSLTLQIGELEDLRSTLGVIKNKVQNASAR